MKTVTSEQIAEVFKIQPPLKTLEITQPFGANNAPFYKNWGLKGHTGVDLRARTPKECFAVCEGFVTSSGFDADGGGFVKLETRPFVCDGKTIKLEFTYYHLSKIMAKSGKWVKAGSVVGLTGATGKYIRGPHLHFTMRVYYEAENGGWEYDGDNGYRGKLNPTIVMTWDWRLPVDKFYGKKRNLILEYTFRFANTPVGVLVTPFLKKRIEAARYVHKRLKREGRTRPILTDREANAIIYGSWDLNDVLDPAMYGQWLQDVKQK